MLDYVNSFLCLIFVLEAQCDLSLRNEIFQINLLGIMCVVLLFFLYAA